MTGYRQCGVIKNNKPSGEKIFFPSWYYCRKSASGFPTNIYERYCGTDKTIQEFWNLLDIEGYSHYGYSELEFRDYSSALTYNIDYKGDTQYVTDRIPKIQCIYWLDNKGNYINTQRLKSELKTFDFYTDINQENSHGINTVKRPYLFQSFFGKSLIDNVKTYYINDDKDNFYSLQEANNQVYKYFDLETVTPWSYPSSMINAINTIGNACILPIAPFKLISRSWKDGYVDGTYRQVYLHLICFCCVNLHEEVIL